MDFPNSPAEPLHTEVRRPESDDAGGRVAVIEPSGNEPGKPLGDQAPSLQSLQGQICPNCHVGVLYVTRYDPLALHEAGQDIFTYNTPMALPAGHGSGGAYDVRCFHCEWTHSFAMNPGERLGKGR